MPKVIIKGGGLINPLTLVYKKEDEDKLNKLMTMIDKMPSCRKKLSQLSQQRNVKIDFTQDRLPCQGQWQPNSSTIQVKRSLSLEKTLQTVIFEVCNATNDYLTKDKIKLSNFESGKNYADYLEMAEHISFIEACSLYLSILNANEDLSMPTEEELQQVNALYSNDNYLAYVKSNGHYEYYVQKFNLWKMEHQVHRIGFFEERNGTTLPTTVSSPNQLQEYYQIT